MRLYEKYLIQEKMKHGIVNTKGFWFTGKRVGIIGPYKGKSDNYKGEMVYRIIVNPDDPWESNTDIEIPVKDITLVK